MNTEAPITEKDEFELGKIIIPMSMDKCREKILNLKGDMGIIQFYQDMKYGYSDIKA